MQNNSKRKSFEERKEGYLFKVRFPNGFNKFSTNERFLCYQDHMGEDGFSTGYMLSPHTLVPDIVAEWGVKADDCLISSVTPHIGFNVSDGTTRFVVIDVKTTPEVDLSYVTVIWFFPF
jgi:hypothetical protein